MTPRVRLLGGCEVFDSEGNSIPFATRKSWGLLAYLSQAKGRDIPREEMAALLWPHAAEPQSRASLRQELAVLRRALETAGVPGITASKDRVQFRPPDGSIDSVSFDELAHGDDIDQLRHAARLYRGDFLSGMNLRSSPFEEWLWLERQRLKNRVLVVLRRLLEHDLASDDVVLGTETAERLLSIDSTQEPAYRALMRLYRRQGRRADALNLYQMCIEVMRRELDTRPSLETQSLAERIRAENAYSGWVAGSGAAGQMDVAILCLRLAGGAGVTPGTLQTAQAKLRTRARRVVDECHGLVMPGLGDRLITVFSHGGRDAIHNSAVQAGLSLTAEPVSAADCVLWPGAGVSFGSAIFGAGNSPEDDLVLAGDPVMRADALSASAPGGAILAGSDVTNHLDARFTVSPIDLSTRGTAGASRIGRAMIEA